jgi:hypothetical protein
MNKESSVRYQLKKKGYRLHKLENGYYQVIQKDGEWLVYGEEFGETLDDIESWLSVVKE